jgi:hypothetical protein
LKLGHCRASRLDLTVCGPSAGIGALARDACVPCRWHNMVSACFHEIPPRSAHSIERVEKGDGRISFPFEMHEFRLSNVTFAGFKMKMTGAGR